MPNYRNIHTALPHEVAELQLHGTVQPSRNGDTKELLNRTVTLIRPLERYIFHPARKHNPFLAIAETMWVLAGKDDVETLSHYNRRAAQWSDDGKTWRGAYGPRLRHIVTPWAIVDPLMEVVKILRDDPSTRQAVVSIWDPRKDYIPGKDIPCNNWLHFIQRSNLLNLNVAVRSQDIWWGWSGVDSFLWSNLLELMAYWVGAGIGSLTTFATSWHLYDHHSKDALHLLIDTEAHPRLLANYPLEAVYSAPTFRTDPEEWDLAMMDFWNVEKQGRSGQRYDPSRIQDPLLLLYAKMLFLHNVWRAGGSPGSLFDILGDIPESDAKVAARQFIERQLDKHQQQEQVG